MKRKVGLLLAVVGLMALPGWLTLTTPEPGEPTVMAHASERPRPSPTVGVTPRSATNVPEPSPFTESDGLLLSGSAVDETDQPMPGVRIDVRPLRPDGGSDSSRSELNRAVLSGPNGRFAAKQLHPGKVEVTFEQRPVATTEQRKGLVILDLATSRHDLALRLEGGALLEGSVTDQEGRLLAGVHVEASRRRLKEPGMKQQDVVVNTGVDGHFAFAHLQPGAYELSPMAEGFDGAVKRVYAETARPPWAWTWKVGR